MANIFEIDEKLRSWIERATEEANRAGFNFTSWDLKQAACVMKRYIDDNGMLLAGDGSLAGVGPERFRSVIDASSFDETDGFPGKDRKKKVFAAVEALIGEAGEVEGGVAGVFGYIRAANRGLNFYRIDGGGNVFGGGLGEDPMTYSDWLGREGRSRDRLIAGGVIDVLKEDTVADPNRWGGRGYRARVRTGKKIG